MNWETILIIDDDDQLRFSFERLLSQEGYRVLLAASGEQGIQILERERPHLIFLDIRLPGKGGMEILRIIKEKDPRIPVIVITAYGTTDLAIEAIRAGAFDYVLKPFEIPELLNLIKNALKASSLMNRPLQMESIPDSAGVDALIGKSKGMQEVYKAIGRVSNSDATVLIRGESGTGKELVARAIYQYSRRKNKPFLVINCVAIPDTLLESELFGYERGAFTGATYRKLGKIEQANGGTVFLDEVGDMAMGIQAKILRLLEEKKIERLGGRDPIKVDVRIIAATNKDLEEAIRSGTFREDLYYRLNVVTIWLPPLKERKEDIPLLVEYFIQKYCKEMEIDPPPITERALAFLKSYDWPGNVRELSNTIQKVLILNKGLPIDVREVKEALKEAPSKCGAELFGKGGIREFISHLFSQNVEGILYERCMDQFSALLISEALRICNGNKSQAAKLLGLSRPTLHAKIEKHKIRMETMARTDAEG